ncbi:primosomal protein N' [Fusobacterium vincentii ATCC 51190]|uniref:Replication restart protein PriA n=2 Tax=Fusobacterium TaxID=848 RepID=A0AAJ1CSQ2_FUSVC|nr:MULTISPECIES: primosomal protein N' [Fusobacterium]ETT02394.1 primosomal protein N' [Fusobacterium sp. CM21]EJG09572.1 primosomal protein N' [Fusobacterium vincentii ATCC 51190]ERT45330.1 primosomal protein N' [Fusobacterium nucleatum CTI-7]MCW0263580.1 primosomal protein N' [Fusobacterium vincentii]STO29555.1 Primosomal protein N' [Fusobacterium vincentii]
MQYFDIYIDSMKGIYTYSDKNDEFEVGENVIVPFRNIKKSGFIIRKNLKENFEFKVLNISSKVKNSLKLSDKQIKLIEWMIDYYLASYDSVMKAMIPKKIKISYNNVYSINLNKLDILSKNLNNEIIKYIFSLTTISYSTAKTKFKKSVVDSLINKNFLYKNENNIYVNIEKFYKLKEENKEIFEYFYKKTIIKKEKLEEKFKKIDIKELEEKEILKIEVNINKKKEYISDSIEKVFKNKSLLNEKQLTIKENIEKSNKKYFLLKGVTGSGKTEIYIELIKKAFFEGYGSIFLVPEISLTPQMVERFQTEFKNNIAILHSSLSDIERAKEWESIYTGEKKIVLGVRSAIFSPVKNLKYIILDEEHEATYKQDSSPRYNAKYVAIKRCLDEDAKLILGSATPSIESYYYAKTGIYELLNLENRYGNAVMPDIQIVDMKQENNLFFSKLLLEEIKNTLLKNEQVILLLNRKGYSTYIQCKDCGYVEECDNCSIKMSYYKSTNRYKCNYCGKQVHYTGKCSKCGSINLIHSGKGIERIEEELKKYFDVSMIKVDSELSRNKDYFSKIYKDFSDKKYSILIGTQIIAKGLHFPNVTLVGVINSDIILNFPDFRSGEKTFQLLTQVSGRAGRGDKKGKVIIQTYEPENNVIKDSKEENYELFYEKEINSRKIFSYPPFSKILNIGFSSEDEERLLEVSKNFYDDIKSQDIELYGPMPSMVYKVQKRYRMNIFAKGSKKKIDNFKKFLKKKLNEFNDTKVRIVIDIDPVNLM